MKTTYKVTVSHPTGFHAGTHEITVTTQPNGIRYCDGRAFGCSRDYLVKTDKDAIRTFLAEHATTVTKIVKSN